MAALPKKSAKKKPAEKAKAVVTKKKATAKKPLPKATKPLPKKKATAKKPLPKKKALSSQKRSSAKKALSPKKAKAKTAIATKTSAGVPIASPSERVLAACAELPKERGLTDEEREAMTKVSETARRF